MILNHLFGLFYHKEVHEIFELTRIPVHPGAKLLQYQEWKRLLIRDRNPFSEQSGSRDAVRTCAASPGEAGLM
jgi:hypothetical protein